MSRDTATRPAPFATPFGRQVRGGGGIRNTILSAVVHVLVIGLLVWGGKKTFIDANKGPGAFLGRGGGGGGGGIRAYAIYNVRTMTTSPPPAPAPKPVVMPTVVPPTIPIPTPQPTPTPPPAPVPPAAPAATPGTGTGTGAGPGTGPGAGSGTGGGTGSGVGTGTGNDSGPGGGGGTVFPPQPQSILLAPTPVPRELQGRELTITFQLNERGEVLNVDVDPPIRDRSFRNEFFDRLKRYAFSPALTRDGRPVAVSFQMKYTLPGH